MKIGDTVKSDKWGITKGVIADVFPCLADGCEKEALTLVGSPQFRYHSENFEVVKENCTLEFCRERGRHVHD